MSKQGFYYCQSRIEDNEKCKIQCAHCKKYYKPLEDDLKRTPRKIKKQTQSKWI